MELSKEEKNGIFEHVNLMYLKTTGLNKKTLKKQFKTWKINKNIGAYELFIHLYNAEDVWERINDNVEFQKKLLCNENDTIPKKRYLKHIRYRDEYIEEMDQKFEDVKNGKGYISKEHHEMEMKQQLKEQQVIIQEDGRRVGKYKVEAEMLREKLNFQSKAYEAKIATLNKIIEELTNSEKCE
jgi:tRNA G10  N-methylase Trm11